MYLSFINHSKQYVIYCIDNGPCYSIPPYENVIVNYNKNDEIHLQLKHNCASYLKKRWFGKEYHLIINSDYILRDLHEHMELYISREKICFQTHMYYDRFFIHCATANIVYENHVVTEAEQMRKLYKKNRNLHIVTDLVTDLLVFTPASVFLLGRIIKVVFGWSIMLYYYIVSYIILACIFSGIRWLLCRRDDKKEWIDFTQFLTNTYILLYYASPGRKPCYGEIELE